MWKCQLDYLQLLNIPSTIKIAIVRVPNQRDISTISNNFHHSFLLSVFQCISIWNPRKECVVHWTFYCYTLLLLVKINKRHLGNKVEELICKKSCWLFTYIVGGDWIGSLAFFTGIKDGWQIKQIYLVVIWSFSFGSLESIKSSYKIE